MIAPNANNMNEVMAASQADPSSSSLLMPSSSEIKVSIADSGVSKAFSANFLASSTDIPFA